MSVRLLKIFLLLVTVSAVLWVLLSTILPILTSFQPSQLPPTLQNKRFQLLIAHPDDEVMFFGPAVNEILKPEYNNSMFVTCYSTGNDAGLGAVRAQELKRSLGILGVTDFEVIDDESKFKDSMKLKWKSSDILEHLKENTDVILTFDANGVSSHPNHISLYNAAINSGKPVLILKSWRFWEKYTSTVLTNHLLLKKLLKFLMPYLKKLEENLPFGVTSTTKELKVLIFSDVSSFILTLSSMINGHRSQMVWFRWGWVFTSRYLNSNELIFLDPSTTN